jgi:uncharacterized membrane protein
MWQLFLGIGLFAGAHLFSTLLPGQRDALKARVGEMRYKLAYSVASLAGLILLGFAYVAGRDSGVMVYEPWNAGRHFAMLLIYVGFILIFSNGSLGHIRNTVKHPFSLGIALWSVAHLLVNGEAAVVAIFGMFFVVAVADIIFSFARGKIPSLQPKWSHDVRGLAVGTVLFLVFAFGFHPYIIGIPVAG